MSSFGKHKHKPDVRSREIHDSDSDEMKDFEGDNFSDDDEIDSDRWNVKSRPSRPKPQNTDDYVQGALKYAAFENEPPTDAYRPGTCNGFWMVPSNVNIADIFGSKPDELNKERIMKSTESYLEFVPEYHQIDIFAPTQEVAEAIKSEFDSLKVRALEKLDASHRRVAGWAKADKPLTEKARKYMERKKAKEMAKGIVHENGNEEALATGSDIQPRPREHQSHNGFFMLPDTKIPFKKWVGEKEKLLNKVRQEDKVFIWYEPGENMLRVSGQTLASVESATARVKNLYLKLARKSHRFPDEPRMAYILNPPGQNDNAIMFSAPHSNYPLPPFVDQPPLFMDYVYNQSNKDIRNNNEQRGSLKIQNRARPNVERLIDVSDDDDVSLLEEAEDELERQKEELQRQEAEMRRQRLEGRLRSQIRNLIGTQLEELRLFDHEVRMKVRFGYFCVFNHPKDINKPFGIDKIRKKMETAVFQGRLDSTIAVSKNHLNNLISYLSEQGFEFVNNPQQSFKIHVEETVKKKPPATALRVPNQRPLQSQLTEKLDIVLTVSLREDSRLGTWTACFLENIVAEVDVACPNSRYSWALELGASERRVKDDMEPFVKKLRLDNDKRLVFRNTENVKVKFVTQKTRWLWALGDNVIEITKSELWDLSDEKPNTGLERFLGTSLLDSSSDKTPVQKPWGATRFSVSLYKKSWRDRFAENLRLDLGHAATWTPADFFDSEKESLEQLVADIRDFIKVLDDNVEKYWDQ